METERNTLSQPVCTTDAFRQKRIHLIGVGGSGMRALAQSLLSRGAIVSGSDMNESSAVQRLIQNGATIRIGQCEQNLPDKCDTVIHSAAIHEQNPELIAARRRGIEVVKYSQMLGRLMSHHTGVAVAGTHGKSTTTGMIAHALKSADADPNYIVGAAVDQLGGPCGVGSGKHFIAEACEYDRSFLNLHAHLAVILNVEEDHLDCYKDLGAIVEAFRSFAAMIEPDGLLVVNGEDTEALDAASGASCEVESFGFEEDCTWRGINETISNGCFEFDVLYCNQKYLHLQLSLPGRHNAYNALAAVAILHHAGLSPEQIRNGVGEYLGARRRLTLKARKNGITVVDDFAHHPTEITASLKALREQYEPKRVWCVFQPHQHSRTRFLLKDFARSFSLADEVIVPDIYFVRDSLREKDYISSSDLVSQIRLHGGTASYHKDFENIVEHLKRSLTEGDLVVTMGAGNVWEVADEIVHWLGRYR